MCMNLILISITIISFTVKNVKSWQKKTPPGSRDLFFILPPRQFWQKLYVTQAGADRRLRLTT